jgi:DNA repair exonuclease SbcCD ATPase subunit
MQTAPILNLDPTPAGKTDADAAPADRDIGRMAESIDLARSEIRRTQLRLEQQLDQQEAYETRMRILTIGLVVLVILFGAASWFAYPALSDHKKTMADLLGMRNFAATLTPRVTSLESKLDKTMPDVAARIDQMESSMKSGLQAVRTQAQSAANQVGQRIRDDFNRSVQAIQSRLTGIESNQREAAERVSQLQNEVTDLKRQIASAREESSAAGERIKQLQEQQQASTNELSGLNQRMTSNQTAISDLTTRVERKRVDFDVMKDQPAEILPGVHLTVKRADQGKQQMDGIVQLSADSPSLSIRGQGIQKPMLFRTPGDGNPLEFVITQVAKNRVVGYVMTTVPAAMRQRDKKHEEGKASDSNTVNM